MARKKKERIIAVADTETDPFVYGIVPKPFGVGYYDGERYFEFFGDEEECIRQFLMFLAELPDDIKERLIIYMHNGGNYDFHFLVQYMEPEVMMIHGRIAKMKIYGVEFRDSYLLLPLPLSAYEKNEIDYDTFLKEVRWEPANFQAIRAYQKSDCIYLHQWVTMFIDNYGMSLTLPGVSFNQLKQTGYEIQTSSRYYDADFRDYYYGGRTQAFKGGWHKKRVYYYDINSAYPDVMRWEHPYGRRYDRYHDLDELPSSKNGMYFARIKARSKGALPWRDPEDESLHFPDDNIEREYFATSWEIEAGLRTKTLKVTEVIEVIKHHYYNHFQEFVDKFYALKKQYKAEGNKPMEQFVKLILNACYGRFALDARKYKKYCLTPIGHIPEPLDKLYQRYPHCENVNELEPAIVYDDELEDADAEKMLIDLTWKIRNDIGDKTIWERDDPGERFYNTATAASITGAVRAKLWETICQCKGVIYCDTDSIMCTKFSGQVSTELGDWEKVCTFDDLYIGGKKLYAGHIKGTSYVDKRIFDHMKPKVAGDYLDDSWKTASKGSQLNPYEIIEIVRDGKVVNWRKAAPRFSLTNGVHFVERNIRRTV